MVTLKAGTAGKVREKVAEIRVLSRGSDVKGAIENRRENSRFTLITHFQEIGVISRPPCWIDLS